MVVKFPFNPAYKNIACDLRSKVHISSLPSKQRGQSSPTRPQKGLPLLFLQ
jgi:hypothetical protein